jgi:hypothetical protein
MQGDESIWRPCHVLRHEGRHSCIIRLDNTGAILQIGLKEPIDVTRACLVCALKPVAAKVVLSQDLTSCELDVEWPSMRTPMPPPARYTRTTHRHKSKRQKTSR